MSGQRVFGRLGVVAGLVIAATVVVSARSDRPVESSSGGFTGVIPARLLDTRPGFTTADGAYAGIGQRRAGTTTELPVTGRGGIPTTAGAVVLNVTATNATARGFLTVWPCGTTRPNASSVNYTPGTSIANGVTINTGTGGRICIYNNQPVDLVIDANGHHPTSGGFTGVIPARLLDTRPGFTTADGAYAGIGQRRAGTTTELPVTGRGGIPTTAGAVVLNVTATNATARGFLTVWPCGTTRPNASSVNYTPGTSIANGVTINTGTGGRICIYNNQPVDLVIDANGHHPTSGGFTGVIPARLLDTRPGFTTADGAYAGIGQRRAGTTTELPVTGRGGIPTTAGAVVLNVTATNATARGFLTVWPCGTTRPNASSVNYTPGTSIANGVTINTGTGGRICIYNNQPVDLVIDANGHFPKSTPVTPPISVQPSIAAGGSHSCAVLATGQVKCWGWNLFGQLGDGTTTDRVTPVNVVGITNAVAVGTGAAHSCAVLSTGQVTCWGANYTNQLGASTGSATAEQFILSTAPPVTDPGDDIRPTPALVTGISDATEIAAGNESTCVLRRNGQISCWGSGALGDGSDRQRATPGTVTGITTAVEVAAGAWHSCARLASGEVRCWGDNSDGQLGDGTTTRRLTPVTVSSLTGARALDAGRRHSCAATSSGQVRCWGDNSRQQLGDGTTARRTTPVPVAGVSGATDVTAGGAHSCAVTSSGQVRCWGDNRGGQLGDGTTEPRSAAVTVSGVTNATRVSSYDDHTCTLLSSKSVRCWGENSDGQLGDGTRIRRPAPVDVKAL
jgi:alpha-tubulin suppressor-like RCC1 family protein